MIARLAPLRNAYPAAFLKACEDSGINVTLAWRSDGEEMLLIGSPLDGLEKERRERLDALAGQLKRGKTRRPAVIALLRLRREERRHG